MTYPKTKKKPKQRTDRQKAHRSAWDWFSKYIRARDTRGGIGFCCTCNALVTFDACDAGHFIPGRKDAYIFEETNCHAQCRKCNRFSQGKWVEYEQFIIDKYGPEECKRLKQLKYAVKKYTVSELREIAIKYREKYKALL